MHKEQNGRTKIHHTKDIQSTRLIQIQKPEGTRRRGPPFPINLSTKSQESMDEILPERKEEGGTKREGGVTGRDLQKRKGTHLLLSSSPF